MIVRLFKILFFPNTRLVVRQNLYRMSPCSIPAICISDIYAPSFFRLNVKQEKEAFDEMIKSDPAIIIHNEINGQLRELIKSNNPSRKIPAAEYPALIGAHLNGQLINHYGVWVYYPWSKRFVHLLDRDEYIEVRTNRNRYKITREEQELLSRKKIGIIGLSVGQSIALTIAMERTCGELRLADFDDVELSNLNRIRTGLHNLGLKKTVIAAREISEIDPFIDIKIFSEGINDHNIDEFFCSGGQIDLLVEVCDGLDVKIISRFKARELNIPVVMDTNDRGMLDVERFDLEPGRPILHGLAGDLDPDKIRGLTNEEKIPYILKMIGAETISTRLKASMLEVEQSINTWPQLASSVALGGAITTDVCRNIFLGRFHDSGRYYIDVDELIKDKEQPQPHVLKHPYAHPDELTRSDIGNICCRYKKQKTGDGITEDMLKEIIHAACLAPSGGNSQPWKFLYKNGLLYILHEANYSFSLLDYNHTGSYIAFGAMLENIELKAATLSLRTDADIFPLEDDHRLIAVLAFTSDAAVQHPFIHLASVISTRMTNRNVTKRILLNNEDGLALINIAPTIPGVKLNLFDSEECIAGFAETLTDAERLRFMHPQGHYDTFVRELRFTKQEVVESADGMDIATLNMSESDVAALRIAKDPDAVAFLHNMNKGSGFKKISAKNVLNASSIGVISMEEHDPVSFLQAGRAVERIWLEANYRKIAMQPVTQIIFMMEQLTAYGSKIFNQSEQADLGRIKERFLKLCKLEGGRIPLFVFRLCYADTPQVRSLRRPIEKALFAG